MPPVATRAATPITLGCEAVAHQQVLSARSVLVRVRQTPVASFTKVRARQAVAFCAVIPGGRCTVTQMAAEALPAGTVTVPAEGAMIVGPATVQPGPAGNGASDQW